MSIQTRIMEYKVKLLGGFMLPGGAGANKVLTSDAEGNGTWASALSLKTSIIATEEARENVAYGVLPTPDEVTITVPEGGLVDISYYAEWFETVENAGRAAIFIDGNQLKVSIVGETGISEAKLGVAAIRRALVTCAIGLGCQVGAGGETGVAVTTGQVVGGTGVQPYVAGVAATATEGGPCRVFMAAGTHTVSVRFKASSGNVKVRTRKLWVGLVGTGPQGPENKLVETSITTAYRNAAQNAAAAAYTTVKLDKVISDPGSNMDVVTNFCYTAPAEGYYHIDGQVEMTLAAKAAGQAYINVNGGEALRGATVVPTEEQAVGLPVSGVVKLAKGDKVTLVVHNSGVEKAISVGTNSFTRLSVARVGAGPEGPAGKPALVTALPGSPVDGEEVNFQSAAMATAGVVWCLRYRAASASTHKWEFVGGPPMSEEVATLETTESLTYVNLTTTGPSVAVPLAGDYLVRVAAALFTNTPGEGVLMSYEIGATAAVDADSITVNLTTNNYAYREKLKANLTAVTLTAKYRVTGKKGTALQRFLSITPVRVG